MENNKSEKSNEFNFESEENAVSNKTPSAKSINKKFCGQRKGAGLWISDESLLASNWRKCCTSNCKEDCTEHFANTEKHMIELKEGNDISGKGVINPNILVIRKTDLLKIGEKGKYHGVWIKGDGEIRNEKNEKVYTCVRKYLLLFLDEHNKPLHTDPIQLTAKGIFQIEFEKKLMNFRENMSITFAAAMKRKVSTMSEKWYAMCVFSPNFESKLVGKEKQSEACITKSYTEITLDNWKSKCVGYDKEVCDVVHKLYSNTENWSARFSKFSDLYQCED